MEKRLKFIFILGILLVLLPLSGLPSDWNIYIASAIGLIIILSIVVHRAHDPVKHDDNIMNEEIQEDNISDYVNIEEGE